MNRALPRAKVEAYASDARTADILESISDAFYAVDHDWRFVYVNRKAEELWGRKREDLIGRVFLDEFPAATGSPAFRAHQEAIRDQQVKRLETLSPVLKIWIDISIYPSAHGLSVYFRDINERKRSEDALRRSRNEMDRQRRLYEAILTNTPDLAYVFDLQHRFIYANEGLLRMWGLTWEEAIGKNCLELGYPDWHAAMHNREIDHVVATKQPIRGEVPFSGTFGRRIYDYIFVPVLGPEGTVEAVAGTTRDVTERKRMEEAHAESEARLKAVFDTAPVGIVFAEAPSGRVLAGNKHAETIFDQPLQYSASVEEYGEWVSFHPDGRRVEGHEYPMARVLAGEERSELEVLCPRRDGGQAWVRLIASPVRTDGRIVGGVAVSLDIDRQKRALAALADARDNLEARILEEVAARQVAQGRLLQAEKLAALGQLAGGIAHDFNNVIQAVAGAATLTGRHAEDPAAVRKFAKMVEDAAYRGASITRRLLAFARRGELRAEAVDIPALLDGLREVLSHTLGPAVSVELDLVPDLAPALVDSGQLGTVLVNLATNARDAMPAGGRLTLSARAESFEDGEAPAAVAPGHYIRLSVTDTGKGMDAATLARATEPFFTTKALGQGTGLGLAMARDFAEQSRGGFSLSSAPGQGTTITLWLPMTDAAAAPVAKPRDGAAPVCRGARRHVLLVDDEDLVRETLAEQLADFGYDVTQAKEGADALKLLASKPAVDLLVTDLAMPGMDGISLIQSMQQRRPGLPAILLTGYAGEAASVAVGEAVSGLFSLLRKPVTGAELADLAAALLEAAAS